MVKTDLYSNPDEFLEEERYETEEQEFAEPAKNTDRDKEIIKQYTARRKAMESHWEPIYKEAREDWAIYNLDQWTQSASTARGTRPKLTVDISRKYVKAVVASTHQTPPGVKLTARSDTGSVKANAMSEALRYFEDRSGAIYTYTWAQECAAVAGFGWGKVSYSHDPQQAIPSTIEIVKVMDPFSIFIDCDSTMLDGSDMIDAVELHGKTSRSKTGKVHKDKATYWYIDEATEQVKWAVIEGDSVESKGIFPGRFIPIVPTFGEYSIIDGKLHCMGLIRQIRDVQRAVNYAVSEGIERMALTPKSPWMMAKGSVDEKDEREYDRSIVEPIARLSYNQYDENDPSKTYNAPIRNNTNPDISWLDGVTQNFIQAAKETTGLYDAALGNEDNTAQSGVALKAKVGASDRGQLVYNEHLQISVKHYGRIMLGIFPEVIEPYGVLPGQKEDGTQIQYPIGDQPTMMLDPNGQPVLDPNGQPMVQTPNVSDLEPSDLDISISSAPAYNTRKQDGLDNMTKLLQLSPEFAPKVADLIVKGMDFPGGDEIAARLAPADAQGAPQVDPQTQQQLQDLQTQVQQSGEQIQQMTQQNQMLQFTIQHNADLELQKMQMKIASDERMKQMDLNVQMAIAQLKEQGTSGRTQAEIVQSTQEHNAQLMAQVADSKARAMGGQVVAPPPGTLIAPAVVDVPPPLQMTQQPPQMPPQAPQM